MRMSFDVDVDEDAAHAAREALVERFGRWLDDHPEHPLADRWDVDLLLGWKWSYGGGDYGLWTRADVDEVLLGHLPRKLSAAPDEAASIPPSLAAFVGFLDDQDLLDERSDPADVVAGRALAQQRSFLDAMDDPANFGMAKRLFSSAALEGVGGDATLDEAALEAAITAFNELPFEQRGEILGLGGPGSSAQPGELDDLDDLADVDLPLLPLRELATTDDLAAEAGAVPLLAKVDAFHAALGASGAKGAKGATGVKLTKAGNLKLADGRRLVAATGVADRVDGVRSTTDLRELFAVGQVAQLAGAAEIVGDRLRPVEAWSKEPPATRWQRVVDAAVEAGAATLTFGAAVPMPPQLAELGDQMALHILAMLWIADEPVPAAAFAEMMEQVATSGDPLGPLGRLAGFLGGDHVASICRARIDDVLGTFADAGLIVVSPGDDDSGSGDSGDQVAFTRAGPRLAASCLAEVGFGVLLPEDVAGLDAGELIDALTDRDGDDVAPAIRLWTSGRGEGAAARELAAELEARPDPSRVVVGFSLLQEIGTKAVDAVRGMLEGPVAGHAWLLLAQHGAVNDEDIPADLAVRAGIDMFLATADLGSPADVIEMLLGNVPADGHRELVDTLAATDHPRTGDILDLVQRHHPDPATATHARKAALRWRTAHTTGQDGNT